MKPPATIFTELLALVRRELYAGATDKTWFAQRQMVKKALLYPARWLEERKVPIPAERYQAIVEGIVATIKANGHLDKVGYMGRYLLTCVQHHMDKHGDAYYQEGKAIRNRVGVFMTALEKAQRGDDATVSTLAQADALLKLGPRRSRPKRTSPATPTTLPPRKVRSDALYYKLTPEQRTEIANRLASGASYRKIIELTASWGIKTSLGALTTYLKEKP